MDDCLVRNLDKLVDQVVGLVDLGQLSVLIEVFKVHLIVLGLFGGTRFLHQLQRLGSHHPVELSSVLESLFGDSVESEKLDNTQRQIRPLGLLVRLLCLLELIVGTEEVCIWKPHKVLKMWVVFRQDLGFFPLVALDVQRHQTLDIIKH